jgi:hypothetical protein
MMSVEDSKCMFLEERVLVNSNSDPVVVMVLSLGFIASVFVLQY